MNNYFIIQAPQFFCSFLNDVSAASARASASSSFAVRVLICSSYVFSSKTSLFCNILPAAAVVVAAAVVAAAVVALQSQFAHGSAVVAAAVVAGAAVVSSLGAGKQEETRWTHKHNNITILMVRMSPTGSNVVSGL